MNVGCCSPDWRLKGLQYFSHFVLQKGFETLKFLVPELSNIISSKESKSSILFKSKYMQLLCIVLVNFHLNLNENFVHYIL